MSALQELLELVTQESFDLSFGWNDLNQGWCFTIKRDGELVTEACGDDPEDAAVGSLRITRIWLGSNNKQVRQAQIDSVIEKIKAHLSINADLEEALVLLRELRER